MVLRVVKCKVIWRRFWISLKRNFRKDSGDLDLDSDKKYLGTHHFHYLRNYLYVFGKDCKLSLNSFIFV